MDEIDCCFSDALLDDVVAQGKAVRQTLCETYSNPEEAWMDGFVAGWFEGHFKTSPMNTQEEEVNVVLDRSF
jgi:hypothetical protein